MLVGGGAALVQLGLSLDALLAALGHTVDVILLDPKEHGGLTLGRIQLVGVSTVNSWTRAFSRSSRIFSILPLTSLIFVV